MSQPLSSDRSFKKFLKRHGMVVVKARDLQKAKLFVTCIVCPSLVYPVKAVDKSGQQKATQLWVTKKYSKIQCLSELRNWLKSRCINSLKCGSLTVNLS